jgi:membrane-associated protease RseP (regulator of RpoE activity)
MSEETPTEPSAAATEPGSAAPESEGSKPSGAKATAFEVPRWAAAALAALVLLGVGFAIGWVAAPGGGEHHRFEFSEGRMPGGGGGGPGGDGLPGGPNGRTLPQVPVPGPGSLNGVFLGVRTQDATGSPSGAQVLTVVSGSPAEQAGLKAGDVITAVDGSPVTSAAQLAERIRAHQPGDQVTLTYTRSGSSAQAQVKLGSPRTAASSPSA